MNEAKASIRPVLSVLMPAFNEAGNLPALHERVVTAMDRLGLPWEWIVVDDHSTDATFDTIRCLAGSDTRIRGVRLARNSGSHAAIICGLAEAQGEAAIVLAADGQDPPEEIPCLVESWRAGKAIVWAEKRAPVAGPMERATSRLFNFAFRRLSGLDSPGAGGSDFFLVSRPVIDVVNSLGERNTNIIALLAWLGFDQARILYDKQSRLGGRSGWTMSKRIRLALDSVLGFSVRPVQMISTLGFLTAALGFVYAAIVVANAALGRPVEGWSSLMVVVLLIGGVQMVMLGVLGEYIWRALDESRGRPRYVIEKRTNDRT
ncbi:glycosyltransferase family 2 protein [Bradyrhizobium sp. 2TAF24]|uniref:glycosyltransferase family 2 protein n=1 Tax=Bradyrhizobium sp. 2TAF24 TaxID=3233011 RepID=UPI003F910AA6